MNDERGCPRPSSRKNLSLGLDEELTVCKVTDKQLPRGIKQ